MLWEGVRQHWPTEHRSVYEQDQIKYIHCTSNRWNVPLILATQGCTCKRLNRTERRLLSVRHQFTCKGIKHIKLTLWHCKAEDALCSHYGSPIYICTFRLSISKDSRRCSSTTSLSIWKIQELRHHTKGETEITMTWSIHQIVATIITCTNDYTRCHAPNWFSAVNMDKDSRRPLWHYCDEWVQNDTCSFSAPGFTKAEEESR